jgi:Winged helix DNA-binding domain
VGLVQVPPRGLWKRSGGVVYRTLEAHLGRPARTVEPVEPAEVVRRYLRAFGPATAADVTAWSRVTRLGPVLAAMREELVPVACEDGTTRWDVPGAPYADGGTPAPPRLLGTYDNLWLSHADRTHVAPEEVRRLWMGPNGGVAATVFVDGFLAGLWRLRDGRVALELARDLSAAERSALDEEVERVEAFVAR